MKRAHTIIAGCIGWDAREVSEQRYQRYTNPGVYSIGEQYFAVGQLKPKHEVGGDWRLHGDQFWAAQENTKVWVCDVATLEAPQSRRDK